MDGGGGVWLLEKEQEVRSFVRPHPYTINVAMMETRLMVFDFES